MCSYSPALAPNLPVTSRAPTKGKDKMTGWGRASRSASRPLQRHDRRENRPRESGFWIHDDRWVRNWLVGYIESRRIANIEVLTHSPQTTRAKTPPLKNPQTKYPERNALRFLRRAKIKRKCGFRMQIIHTSYGLRSWRTGLSDDKGWSSVNMFNAPLAFWPRTFWCGVVGSWRASFAAGYKNLRKSEKKKKKTIPFRFVQSRFRDIKSCEGIWFPFG